LTEADYRKQQDYNVCTVQLC